MSPPRYYEEYDQSLERAEEKEKQEVVYPKPEQKDPRQYDNVIDLRERKKAMGEAKDIVGTKEGSMKIGDKYSVIDKLEEVIEDLDRANDIKQHDLGIEGKEFAAENNFKLGILRAADSLVRRAKAMLEDYGADLNLDTDPTTDYEAVNGENIVDLREGVN